MVPVTMMPVPRARAWAGRTGECGSDRAGEQEWLGLGQMNDSGFVGSDERKPSEMGR